MNIIVCIKQVPDTTTKVRVGKDGKHIDPEGVKFIVNTYDDFAVEEAIRLKERFGGEVTVISMGPERVKEALRMCLAMGADKAIQLWDPAFEDSDPYTTALILSKAIQQLPYDIIFCGKQAIDRDTMSVPVYLAELLGLPQATIVVKLEVDPNAKKFIAYRDIEGAKEVIEGPLPAVISTQWKLNEPRYPTLPNIMKAKKKELKELNAAALGLDPAQVGEKGSRVKVLSMELPPPRSKGKILKGDPREVSRELVRLLREEAKVV